MLSFFPSEIATPFLPTFYFPTIHDVFSQISILRFIIFSYQVPLRFRSSNHNDFPTIWFHCYSYDFSSCLVKLRYVPSFMLCPSELASVRFSETYQDTTVSVIFVLLLKFLIFYSCVHSTGRHPELPNVFLRCAVRRRVNFCFLLPPVAGSRRPQPSTLTTTTPGVRLHCPLNSP